LASLRRRLRWVIIFRGLSWTFVILSLGAATVGVLDWKVHLPDLVRTFCLSWILAAACYVAYRLFLHPLSRQSDDLSLALRIETRYPELKDSLASAVEFLDCTADNRTFESGELRRAAIKSAVSAARRHDFHRVVNTRGLPAAGLSLLAAGVLAAFLVCAFPALTNTALLRLADPFGDYQWPRQTEIEINARNRVARGEAFEIGVELVGLVPQTAQVQYSFEGLPPSLDTCEVKFSDNPGRGSFTARLESARVQNDFRFCVQANDATSTWREVSVRPPPLLVPLGGRPSPQITLRPPAYTDLPIQPLPDGTCSIEAVAGTEISVAAASDRPLRRAWLAPPADHERTLTMAAFLAPLAAPTPAMSAQLCGALSGWWKRVPARLNPTGTTLSLDFVARLSGNYVLHFEDESGMENSRLIELRVFQDPAPLVTIERPSRSQDSRDVLPDAEVTLQVAVEDQIFAIRSAHLDYRIRPGDPSGDARPDGRLPLYDHESLGQVIAQLLASLAPWQAPVAAPLLRLRPQRLPIVRRLPLAELDLREGDLLVLQAWADDFDDVTAGKKPGQSQEIEIRIIGRVALELALDEAQTQMQQELLRLHRLQRDALAQVTAAEAARDGLKPNDQAILQAEQLEQQFKSRIGSKDEGLRAQLARIMQSLKDNHLPRSGIHDRTEAVDRETDRIARENLPQVESLLARARKQSNAGTILDSSLLSDARQQQEQIEQALEELLKLLEPWSTSHELKSEAESIFEEERKLARQVATLKRQIPPGAPVADLKDSHKLELEKAAELQSRLADRTAQLLEKSSRMARERQASDPAAALQLKNAADRGERNNAAGQMQEAAKNIRENKLAAAEKNQQQSIQAIDEILAALEDRREQDLDRLIKKLSGAEEKLRELADQQDRLQKKTKQAAQITDPAQHAAELKRLAREQEQLEKKAEELVRELNRLRADRAGQALGQAGDRMHQARRQLEQKENSDQSQEDALDRLNESREEMQQARQHAQNELVREKVAQISDQLKGLKARQESLSAESARIHREVLQQKQWTRGSLGSLATLADAQGELGEEMKQSAQDKLIRAGEIYAHLGRKAAEAMKQASDAINSRREQALDRIKETSADDEPELDLQAELASAEEIDRQQGIAIRRIGQLLETLKPDNNAPASSQRGEQKKGIPQGGVTGQPDNLPSPGEIKVLLDLQEELNARTRAFDNAHADPGKWSEKDRQEVQKIQHEQQEIADLFDGLMPPAQMQKEKK
jgi:hypothetical protein